MRTSLALILLLSSLAAPAQTTNVLTKAQEDFVQAFLKAHNSRDQAKLLRIVHPKCVGWMNKEQREYLKEVHSDQALFHRRLSGENVQIRAIGAQEPLWAERSSLSNRFYFPIRPSHELRFGKEIEPSSRVHVVEDNGKWFMVAAVPTAATLESFKLSRPEREERKAKAKKLYQKLDQGSRGELLKLLREGKTREALASYKARSGEDTLTSTEVLKLLWAKK